MKAYKKGWSKIDQPFLLSSYMHYYLFSVTFPFCIVVPLLSFIV